MKRLFAFFLLVGTSIATAQDPMPMPMNPPTPKAPVRFQPPATVSPSPSDKPAAAPQTHVPAEMWYYEKEMARLDDPKMIIRRNAQYRAAQRRGRIESSRWFGFSKARPQASPIPYMGTASPRWMGNGLNPSQWIGTDFGRSALFVYPGAYYR